MLGEKCSDVLTGIAVNLLKYSYVSLDENFFAEDISYHGNSTVI